MEPTLVDRCLIVNADDFGVTAGVNRGITEAHEQGIVTSASLMVRYPAAAEAAEYARRHLELSVGLHVELGEWLYQAGEWQLAYQVVDAADGPAVQLEFNRQLTQFQDLLGRAPTHLDSHQHAHQQEPARSILQACAERLHIPLRGITPAIAYCGSFYGQTRAGDAYREGITPDRLIELISTLPLGWTELGCHPGYAEGLHSVYLTEREDELRALCSPEVCAALWRECVRLNSFHDFARD